MKKRVVIPALVLVLGSLTLYFFGVTPRYIASAPSMLVGFSAKTACSLHYVGQLPKDQVLKDLTVYSALFGLPVLNYQEEPKSVTATLLWETATAIYQPNVGCTRVNAGQPLPTVIEGVNYIPDDKTPAPSPELNQKLSAVLEADNAQGYDTRALLVMQGDGRVLAEAYAPSFGPQTVFMGWSMSKTLMAAIIGSLEYRNVIAPAKQPLFNEWANDKRAAIRLEQLLTMTSGLAFNEVYEPGADATKMLFQNSQASLLPLLSSPLYEPGTFWSYSSGSANLLALYAHRALGGQTPSTQRYIQEYVLNPLNMQNAVLEMDASGIFVGSSFALATAKEWGNLGALFLNKGKFNDYQIVDEQWVEKALSPNEAKNDSRYGYSIWLNKGVNNEDLRWPDLPPNSYAAMGSRGQLVLVVPELQCIIVRLGWSKNKYPTSQRMLAVLQALALPAAHEVMPYIKP